MTGLFWECQSREVVPWSHRLTDTESKLITSLLLGKSMWYAYVVVLIDIRIAVYNSHWQGANDLPSIKAVVLVVYAWFVVACIHRRRL